MSWRIPASFEAHARAARSERSFPGLRERLGACAALVPPGARVADIGADHGILANALLAEGRASFVSAVDLSHKALAGATARLQGWAKESRAETVCGDGLTALGDRATSVDCAIVAGTGAATAIEIAQRAAAKGARPARWIVQPAGGLGDVREAMVALGYGIAAERIVADDRRLFGLIAFDANAGRDHGPGQGTRSLRDDVDVVVGPWLRADRSWEVAAWLDVQEDWLAEKLRCATESAMTKAIARDLGAIREARQVNSSPADACTSAETSRR